MTTLPTDSQIDTMSLREMLNFLRDHADKYESTQTHSEAEFRAFVKHVRDSAKAE